MPHQCVHCGKMYPDGAKEILEGCKVCGSKLFFFIKKEKLDEMKKVQSNLNENEKRQIEKDIIDLIGEERIKDNTVVLDIEAICIPKPGEYEIDLVKLFKGEPVVFKTEEGKYFIDLKRSFKNVLDKVNKKK